MFPVYGEDPSHNVPTLHSIRARHIMTLEVKASHSDECTPYRSMTLGRNTCYGPSATSCPLRVSRPQLTMAHGAAALLKGTVHTVAFSISFIASIMAANTVVTLLPRLSISGPRWSATSSGGELFYGGSVL